ncbi:hypothetical protein WJU16_10510 [Chitinophaga pollutisoli]|uniref:Uncharacterized protein n=1 Tax=Chitinophaga pollutisoli TaxID=3133966 RepID=A0ABZ2YUP6_9BACT
MPAPPRPKSPVAIQCPEPAKTTRTAPDAAHLTPHAARELLSRKALQGPPQYTYHDRHPASAVPLPAPLLHDARIPQTHKAIKALYRRIYPEQLPGLPFKPATKG